MAWRMHYPLSFLGKIKEAFDRNPTLSNLLLDPFFQEVMDGAQESWRRVAVAAIKPGYRCPCMTSAAELF